MSFGKIHVSTGQNKLQQKFLLGSEAQIALHDNLDIVVQKADESMTQGQHQRDEDMGCKASPKQGQDQGSQHHQAAHGGSAAFFHVAGRSTFANGLTKFQFM